MRKLFALSFFLLALAPGLRAQNKVATVHIKTKIACDHCKLCESCGKRIEDALYDRKGVKRVDVDEKKMEIVVVYQTAKITPAQIRETIAANGYDADEQKATAESVARLDACCRGQE